MCGNVGQIVKSSTVEYIANFEKNSLEKEIMIACLKSDCEIVYFSSVFYPLVFDSQLDIEIGYKTSSKHKYVCYCHKLTKDDIVDYVLIKDLRIIKDIISKYGDIRQSSCQKKHPLGCDCTKDMRRIIDDTLKDNNLI